MATAHCFVCGRWNDPTGGPDAHSSGCPNAGTRYDAVGCRECGDTRERPDGLCHPCAARELETGEDHYSGAHDDDACTDCPDCTELMES